jgi:hypothetical protein
MIAPIGLARKPLNVGVLAGRAYYGLRRAVGMVRLWLEHSTMHLR